MVTKDDVECCSLCALIYLHIILGKRQLKHGQQLWNTECDHDDSTFIIWLK